MLGETTQYDGEVSGGVGGLASGWPSTVAGGSSVPARFSYETNS